MEVEKERRPLPLPLPDLMELEGVVVDVGRGRAAAAGEDAESLVLLSAKIEEPLPQAPAFFPQSSRTPRCAPRITRVVLHPGSSSYDRTGRNQVRIPSF